MTRTLGSLSLKADLYDPATNTFSSAGSNVYQRLYHSVALLLPDASVWITGGNPTRGSYEPHMEIYKPAYFFNSSGGAGHSPDDHKRTQRRFLGQRFHGSNPGCGEYFFSRPGPERRRNSRVQHGPAAGWDVLYGGQWSLDCDRASHRQHRSARLLHAVSSQQQRRAIRR